MSLDVWRIGYSGPGGLTLSGLGFGSTLGDGRWHTGCAGPLQLVYCGATRALCQLERRVHCNGATPGNMAMLRLEIPDAASILDVNAMGLPLNWKINQAVTQALGMAWLKSGASLGMWVPSYVEPAERNLLLNPSHPEYAGIQLVIEQNPFVFDPRLFP